MQVLKFGGTSVANAENILKVIAIAEAAAKQTPTVVVVSALGGITDALIAAGQHAAAADESYKEQLQRIEQRHLDTVKALLPVTDQSATLRWDPLESTCRHASLSIL